MAATGGDGGRRHHDFHIRAPMVRAVGLVTDAAPEVRLGLYCKRMHGPFAGDRTW